MSGEHDATGRGRTGGDARPAAPAVCAGREVGAPSAASDADTTDTAGTEPDLQDVRAELSRRTRQILETPRPAPDPARAEREKEVLRACRALERLLAVRRRSAGELRQRLRDREVPAAVAHEAMARLDRAGLLDDAAFAEEWVRQRRDLRALSDEALRRELRGKQVDPELVERALAQGGEDAEEARCRELVRARLGERDRAALRADRDGSARRRVTRRLDALLTRRGYPGDLAVQVISAEVRAARDVGAGHDGGSGHD